MGQDRGLHQIGRARWELRVSVRQPDGSYRRRKKRVDAKTKIEARGKLNAFRDEVLRPAPDPDGPGGSFTLASYVERYWDKITMSVRERTLTGYDGHLQHLVLPELGHLDLRRVNDVALADFAGRMKKGINTVAAGAPKPGGYAPNTIKHCLALVRRILNDAVEREALPASPIKRRVRLEKPVLLELEMNEEERAAFLAAFENRKGHGAFWEARRDADRGKRNQEPVGFRRSGGPWTPTAKGIAIHFRRFRATKPFFVVALETGLRLGDLLALNWADIDLKEGWVRVRTGKRGNIATIPVSDELRAALDVLRFQRGKGGEVFPGASWTILERYFRIAKRIAGIHRRLRFHDLRHTFASRMVSAGVSLQAVARMLGHSSIQMVQRYARVSDEALKAALDLRRMSPAMSPPTQGTGGVTK